jgi:hypothetical protein
MIRPHSSALAMNIIDLIPGYGPFFDIEIT